MAVDNFEAISTISTTEVVGTKSVNNSPTITEVAGDGKFDSVSNLNDLKEKAPDVYHAMMQGIGMKICNEMQKHQKRFRDILKKARDNA